MSWRVTLHCTRAEAEAVAPVRQGPGAEGPGKLGLDRPEDPVGVPPHRLDADEQAGVEEPDGQAGGQERGEVGVIGPSHGRGRPSSGARRPSPRRGGPIGGGRSGAILTGRGPLG